MTDEQAAIVDSVRAHAGDRNLTVVDAGAGSGKTYTTIATVLELLEHRPQTSLDRFVLITFTRKAADNLRQSLEKSLLERQREAATEDGRRRWADARERLSSAYVGTIHGFCRQLLRAFGHGSLVARESDVEFAGGLLYEAISDTFEEQLEAEPHHPLLVEMGRSYQAYDLEALVKEIYDDVRNRGLDPVEVAGRTALQTHDPGKDARVAAAELVRRVHEIYDRKKKDGQLVDAADLLLRTAEVLEAAAKSERGILRKVAARYGWVFVDEFQDTDRVQERIVEALRPYLSGVLLVGDVKQSIYGFRGAGLQLEAIARRHGVEVLPLSVSRRPTRQLLEAQNALFASVGRNYPNLDRPLQAAEEAVEARSALPPIGRIEAGPDTTPANGARATAAALRRLLTSGVKLDDPKAGLRPIVPGDVAVLFRSNWALDLYERELTAHLGADVPVRRAEGGQFFRRPEVIAAYRLLRFVLDYPDEVALAQALRTPYLRRRADVSPAERGILGHGRIKDSDLRDWLAGGHRSLEEAVRDLQASVRINTVSELLENIYRGFDVRGYHEAGGERRELDNLERLREMSRTLTDTEQALTARMFLRWLQGRLLGGFDEPEAADAPDEDGGDAPPPPHVRLMTVHKAKGLEFPVVIIPETQAPINGGGDGRVTFIVGDWGLDLNLKLASLWTASPQFRTRTHFDVNAQRHESMRVFYVAVTRARNAVIFVGAGDQTTRSPTDPKYSWKDEIVAAWPELARLGGRLKEYPSPDRLARPAGSDS